MIYNYCQELLNLTWKRVLITTCHIVCCQGAGFSSFALSNVSTLTHYSAVMPKSLAIYPYPAVVKRQPTAAEGDSEANNHSNPMPGSALWPPIGITMQYVPSPQSS